MSSLNSRTLHLHVALLVLLFAGGTAHAGPIQNVIVMIGDGMGPEHVAAARAYNGGPLVMESAPNHALMTTNSVTPTGVPTLTDSAASATAMATGHKVTNLAVSVQFPGDLSDLETSLEIWKDRGKSTGLVTTSYIEDATPAAFGAHTAARFFTNEIADDYLNRSRPNLLLGGTQAPGITPALAAAAGYTVVETRAALDALDLSSETHISGQFGDQGPGFEYDDIVLGAGTYDDVPFLTEMTSTALDFLGNDPDGFFLMVEQENTDLAGHLGGSSIDRIGRDVYATLEFDASIQRVLDWIALRPDPSDTLLIVTADHETGGLEVLADNGAGVLPTVSWAHSDHTPVMVDVWGWGMGSELVTGSLDNTDIFSITTVPEPGTSLLLGLALSATLVARRPRQ